MLLAGNRRKISRKLWCPPFIGIRRMMDGGEKSNRKTRTSRNFMENIMQNGNETHIY
jgi:hypothetical protein